MFRGLSPADMAVLRSLSCLLGYHLWLSQEVIPGTPKGNGQLSYDLNLWLFKPVGFDLLERSSGNCISASANFLSPAFGHS